MFKTIAVYDYDNILQGYEVMVNGDVHHVKHNGHLPLSPMAEGPLPVDGKRTALYNSTNYAGVAQLHATAHNLLCALDTGQWERVYKKAERVRETLADMDKG